ncbi:MAG: GNAT family N-acetyltransferase [Caldilineales bacterium]
MPYRPIHEHEIPIVAGIQAQSFRSDPARYVESYTEGARMGWRELRLYEGDDGQAVAALTLFFRRVSLNGGDLEAGLVGSVGVPPEHRRRGYGRHMMQGLLHELHNRRTPVSLLFPFSVAWYRSLGYGLANLSWHIEQPMRLLPDFPERRHVRRATVDDEAAMRACHEQARLDPANNGWLSRTEAEWAKRAFKLENERALFEVDGQVQGYLLYRLDWDALEVIEWVATSEPAWRGLLAFISAQGEQARQLKANLPQQNPVLWALGEPYDRTEEVVDFVFRRGAVLVNGYMLRVVHLPEALRQRRYPVDVAADLIVEVEDRQLPDNSQPIRLVVEHGRATVTPLDEPPNTQSMIRTDMATFSQLYAGLLTAEQARLAGALHGDDASCRALTAALAAAPWHMWPADWF